MKSFISVIVPVYRDWNRIRLCLEALEKQSFPKKDFEVIIVNNDPLDPKPSGLLLSDNVFFTSEKKPGSYAARNTGIKFSKGEILAFTDSDCIPDLHWLNNASHHFKDTSIDMIGGQVEIFCEVGGSKLIYTYEKYTSFPQERNVPLGKGVTANLFVRREVVEKIGGFNSDIKSGGDWEFTQRCVLKNYVFKYYSDVIVKHPARKSFKHLLIKEKRMVAWGIINSQAETGQSKMKIVLRQLKSSIRHLYRLLTRKVGMYEKAVFLLIGSAKLVYRFSLGLFIILRLVNPKAVRK